MKLERAGWPSCCRGYSSRTKEKVEKEEEEEEEEVMIVWLGTERDLTE